MKGRIDMSSTKEQGEYSLPAVGIHTVELIDKIDKESSNGDPMVSIKLEITEGTDEGCLVWDNILIPSPDSSASKILGRTKHFLHCIGEPYEGEIEWDSNNWIGKVFKIKVGHELPNQYHKNTRAIVSGYVISDEETASSTIPPQNEELPF